MADKQVSELTDIDALADADSFPVRDASATSELREVTASQIATYMASELGATFDAAGTTATHIADGTDAHAASAISFTPGGTVAATNAQTAIAEVATDAAADATTKANAAQAAAVQRANHTGTQVASTISDFSTAVAATAAVTANTAKVTNATHTGEVTGATALTIATAAVTNAKLANMATATIKGRVTAGTGVPEDLTATQARTVMGLGALATLATAGTAQIDNDAVTNAKAANMAASTIKGRVTASTGDPEDLTPAQARTVIDPLNTVGATGATEALLIGTNDCTMDQNCEFTFPTVGAGRHEFTLILRGAFTPTFPGSVDWSGGAPAYATPSEYSFATVDSGTTWFGVGRTGFA
jgi:hypothetical protein